MTRQQTQIENEEQGHAHVGKAEHRGDSERANKSLGHAKSCKNNAAKVKGLPDRLRSFRLPI